MAHKQILITEVNLTGVMGQEYSCVVWNILAVTEPLGSTSVIRRKKKRWEKKRENEEVGKNGGRGRKRRSCRLWI